jgi:PAS domain S-box-containing protein
MSTGTTSLPIREAAWLAWQALDQFDDLILVLERDQTAEPGDAVIVLVNGAFRRASGWSDPELCGSRLAGLFPEPNAATALTEAIGGNSQLRTDMACARADGGTFIFGLHLMPAVARTPACSCFVILGRDITAQVEARRMRNSLHLLLVKVFTSVDDAVAIVNSAGRIVMTNPRFDQLLGFEAGALEGRITLDLVVPDARAAITDTVQRQMLDGATTSYIAPLVKGDGSQVVVTVVSAMVTMEDEKRFRVITMRPLASATRRAGVTSAGRIKLVGLEDVRAVLGDRWHSVAERAMATAEVIIKRRLGHDDSHARVDDVSFLVCFGALDEREASFRAAMIAREIRDRLIGQGNDPDTAYVRSIAAAVRDPGDGGSDASPQSSILDQLDAQIERIEREARHQLRTSMNGASCELIPVFGTAPAQVVAYQAVLPAELEHRLVSALAALPAAEAAAFDVHSFVLGLAAGQAVAGLARGESIPLLVNVSFDVFATHLTVGRYLAVCERIDRRVSRQLILLLSSLPNGLMKSRQLDCVNRLRPFCLAVGYQVDGLSELKSIDLSYLGQPIVSLPAAALEDQDPEKLGNLLRGLRAKRGRVLIRSVASDRDAAWFRYLGAEMIAMLKPAR